MVQKWGKEIDWQKKGVGTHDFSAEWKYRKVLSPVKVVKWSIVMQHIKSGDFAGEVNLSFVLDVLELFSQL